MDDIAAEVDAMRLCVISGALVAVYRREISDSYRVFNRSVIKYTRIIDICI